MEPALDLISKVIGVLAALLGLAGYVLVLGSAILWLRLHEAGLPPALPVSLATQQELIVIGAQAVAVWALLAIALAGLGAWIVTGDPKRRPFGYIEAGLALTVTLSTLLALEIGETGLIAIPAFAVGITALVALVVWPSWEAIAALLLPTGIGVGLAALLSAMGNVNHAATAAGATFIFGALVLLAPWLQSWRARQDANQAGLASLKAIQGTGETKTEDDKDPLAAALARGGGRRRSPAVVWVERAAIAAVTLIVIGAVAVASQVSRSKDFNAALVSLTNGDCIEGTFVTRGNEQVVLAEPDPEDAGKDKNARLTAIPAKEVLEVQVYGGDEEGAPLVPNAGCAGNEDVLVHSAKGHSSPGQ
jgi:hypothetical protein